MKCSNCKGRNKKEAKFCRHCGEELTVKSEIEEIEESKETKEPKSYKGKILYGLLMVAVLIITFITAYMIVSSSLEGSVKPDVITK